MNSTVMKLRLVYPIAVWESHFLMNEIVPKKKINSITEMGLAIYHIHKGMYPIGYEYNETSCSNYLVGQRPCYVPRQSTIYFVIPHARAHRRSFSYVNRSSHGSTLNCPVYQREKSEKIHHSFHRRSEKWSVLTWHRFGYMHPLHAVGTSWSPLNYDTTYRLSSLARPAVVKLGVQLGTSTIPKTRQCQWENDDAFSIKNKGKGGVEHTSGLQRGRGEEYHQLELDKRLLVERGKRRVA